MGTWIYEVWGEGASVHERKGDGGADTAAGLVALRPRKTALDKRLAAKTRAEFLPAVLISGSNIGASLLAPLPAD